jgi:glycosyltransferase involved in cell wall biosynthesis
MMKKTVVMISPNNFPNGDAGAVRDLSFAKIYMKLGYTPVVFCLNRKEKSGVYEGIQYHSYFIEAGTILSKVIRYVKQKNIVLEMVERVFSEKGNISLIHLYGVSNIIFECMIRFARNHNITLIHDSVEWYSPCEFKHGKWDISYIVNNRLNTRVVRNPVKVIAISEFLKDHFVSRGIQTKRIPVIMDVKGARYESHRQDDVINLIYAGSPANKDYLKEIILAVQQLDDEEKQKLKLNIYGASEEQIINSLGVTQLDKCVIPHGRVAREVVKAALLESDFSLLLRPQNERYTKAGFPTKSVEAMSHGVAMICNLTSDLGMYLRDGENAIIVNDCSVDAMTEAIRKALKLDRASMDRIKRNARITAEINFDYRCWIDIVGELIEE